MPAGFRVYEGSSPCAVAAVLLRAAVEGTQRYKRLKRVLDYLEMREGLSLDYCFDTPLWKKLWLGSKGRLETPSMLDAYYEPDESSSAMLTHTSQQV